MKPKLVKTATVIESIPHLPFILLKAVLFLVSLSIIISGATWKIRAFANRFVFESHWILIEVLQVAHPKAHRKLHASHLTLLERRRTADHADILVKKEEECSERKLEFLQNSFEYEKEKILKEFED